MRQIAILAGLTLGLIPVAVDSAAAEDCVATNCAINAPPNTPAQNTGDNPKLDDALKELSKDTERALNAPKPPEATRNPSSGDQSSR
jgi:hypothetical protein